MSASFGLFAWQFFGYTHTYAGLEALKCVCSTEPKFDTLKLRFCCAWTLDCVYFLFCFMCGVKARPPTRCMQITDSISHKERQTHLECNNVSHLCSACVCSAKSKLYHIYTPNFLQKIDHHKFNSSVSVGRLPKFR